MLKLIAPVLFFVGLAATTLLQPQPAQATDYKVCENPPKGVLRDQFGGTDQFLTTYHMNRMTIKNTSQDCTYWVGIASYKAYEHYETNVYSQTLHDDRIYMLKPGETWTYVIAIPECTYQVDAFWGNSITQFSKPNGTYSGQNRLLDGWYFPGDAKQRAENRPFCVKHTPTPTPTPTATPTPTPTVTPTPTPTPEVTPTPCPSGTVRDGDKCGQVQAATPTPEPPTELPSTGPGVAVAVSLIGMVGGLIGKKLL